MKAVHLQQLLFFLHRLLKTKTHLFCNRSLYCFGAFFQKNLDTSTFFIACIHLDNFV